MTKDERYTLSLYTSKKYYKALGVIAKIKRTSKAKIMNKLIKNFLDENKETLEKRKVDYE